MNMYAKQTSRMISPSGSGASAGKGFMPFLKQCSTYFPKLAVAFFHIGWDIFLREGMKPSHAVDVCCIAALSCRWDGVYPRPTNNEQELM
jgi:hypothetical protein